MSVELVSLDNGNGFVEPSIAIADYPMARPLHMYTDAYADNREDVKDTFHLHFQEGQEVVER